MMMINIISIMDPRLFYILIQHFYISIQEMIQEIILKLILVNVNEIFGTLAGKVEEANAKVEKVDRKNGYMIKLQNCNQSHGHRMKRRSQRCLAHCLIEILDGMDRRKRTENLCYGLVMQLSLVLRFLDKL